MVKETPGAGPDGHGVADFPGIRIATLAHVYASGLNGLPRGRTVLKTGALTRPALPSIRPCLTSASTEAQDMTAREPVLNPVRIADLRPTQITVGFREVSEKQKLWRERSSAAEDRYLGRHMIPVVLGRKSRPYVLDHHHLCRALQGAGDTEVLVNVIADLSHLAKSEFWVFMDNRGWCHPYDAEGERRAFKDIPKSMEDLADDPFRSLAGDLRRAGGFAKDTTPFSEFIWADFLRRRLERGKLDAHPQAALVEALKLARDPAANHLPGWCGPIAED